MEQINELKRLLTVSSINLKVFNGYYLNSIQLIAISGFLSLSLCILVQTLSPVYLIFGLLLPIFFEKNGIKTQYYWQCFAALMVFRRFVVWMAVLDVPAILFRLF